MEVINRYTCICRRVGSIDVDVVRRLFDDVGLSGSFAKRYCTEEEGRS